MPCCTRVRSYGPDTPITLGDVNGAVPVRARVTLPVFGLAPGATAWFTGSDVDAWAAAESIVIG